MNFTGALGSSECSMPLCTIVREFYPQSWFLMQNFVAVYTDTFNSFQAQVFHSKSPKSLNVRFSERAIYWNFTFSDFLVFSRFEINLGLGVPGSATNAIDSAFVALFMQHVSAKLHIDLRWLFFRWGFFL